MDIQDVESYNIIEVTFKNGSRKGYYVNQMQNRTSTGDMVVVESSAGYDVGRISLSGDLVRLQLKKRRLKEDDLMHRVLRRANERDLEKLDEARGLEYPTMVRARAIARTLDLDMKIGDVEFQGDRRKATFYYIADGRVDFRELIRHFAKEFRVKIEMRQIGARQESARIGGIGSCGRELCCSTWLTDFKSVSTAAARYQNLAINQAKLSGQCGRLKCCLNYELDTYMEALEKFPDNADRLKTEAGIAVLVKTDIFKGIMYYAYEKDGMRGKHHPLSLARVHEIKELNGKGQFPTDLVDLQSLIDSDSEPELDFDDDVTGVIELPPEEKKRRRRNRGRGRNQNQRGDGGNRSNRNQSGKGKGSPSGRAKDAARNEAKPKPNPQNRTPKDGNKRGATNAPKGRNPRKGGGGRGNRTPGNKK
jgi:cell fate regulator YaaT (PSP1 superfamily)